MTDQHPITPPPELMQQWEEDYDSKIRHVEFEIYIATQAAQWGADTELEACCALLELSDSNARDFLQSARRPKPPSLKEQALKTLEDAPGPDHPKVMTVLNADQHALIRRALEALPDD